MTDTESMVERVARAINPDSFSLAEDLTSPNREWDLQACEHAYQQARAAIAALREPNEAMIGAGGYALLGNYPMAETVWRAMIDAILAEKADG